MSEILENVKARKFFYRDYYRKALALLLILLLIAGGLILGIIYEVLTSPERQYYATGTNGDLFPMAPTSPPSTRR